jgi:hypothetical protein
MSKLIAAFRNGVIWLAKALWRVVKVVTGIPLAIAVITPAVALTILGISYTLGSQNLAPDRALQTALFGYGVLASLSALCFTAASAVDKSTRFYTHIFRIGRYLFQATLYMVLAGVMQYAQTNFLIDLSLMQANPTMGPPPVMTLVQSPTGAFLGEVYTIGVAFMFALGGAAVTVSFIDMYIFLIKELFDLWKPESTE